MTPQEMVDFLRAAAGGGAIHDGKKAYLQAAELIESLMAELENTRFRMYGIETISRIKTGMVESLTSELAEVKRERDAAIAEIGMDCETCKFHEACHSPVFCDECGELGSDKHPCCTCENLDRWEWRGMQEGGCP